MDPDNFVNSPGRVEMGSKGYFYYVPSRVPESRTLDADAVQVLAAAQHQLGQLNAWGAILPNPHLLIRPYIQREALLSSKIEGTQATLSEVLLGEAGEPVPGRAADVEEVLNYVRALEVGQAAIAAGPISLATILDLHRILMQGVRGADKTPGEFRQQQNWIGAEGSPLEEASYVPPEPQVMKQCLADFEKSLEANTKLPPLVHIALLHYQFEAIHPFRDGNGRIGRLLITLLLLRRQLLNAPFLYLSAYFEKNRNGYYDHLMAISQKGDFDGWLRYFLRGVEGQAIDANERCRRLIALHKDHRDRLHAAQATSGAFQLLDHLFANPFMTINRAKDILGVTFPTAQRAVEGYLAGVGILHETTGKERNRRFVAKEILQLTDMDLSGPSLLPQSSALRP